MVSGGEPGGYWKTNAPTTVIRRPGILCRRDRACVATVRFVTVHRARQEGETFNLKGDAAGRPVFPEASTLQGSTLLDHGSRGTSAALTLESGYPGRG